MHSSMLKYRNECIHKIRGCFYWGIRWGELIEMVLECATKAKKCTS